MFVFHMLCDWSARCVHCAPLCSEPRGSQHDRANIAAHGTSFDFEDPRMDRGSRGLTEDLEDIAAHGKVRVIGVYSVQSLEFTMGPP